MHLIDLATALIEAAEGFSPTVYRDIDKWAIGFGQDLDSDTLVEYYRKHGITREEAEVLVKARVIQLVPRLETLLLCWNVIGTVRQAALVDMAYELGFIGLFGFHKMIDALERGNYVEAARQVLDSKYAKQVPERARSRAEMLRTGNCDSSVIDHNESGPSTTHHTP